MSELCTVTGTLYAPDGSYAKAGTPFTLLHAAKSGRAIATQTCTVHVVGNAGGVTFTALKNSDTYVISNAYVGSTYLYKPGGVKLTIPDADTATLESLGAAVTGPTTGLTIQDDAAPLAGLINTINFGTGLTAVLSSAGVVEVSSSGAVSSVFGRTGAVVAASNDYTWAQIDKTTSSLVNLTTRLYSDLQSIPSTFTPSAHDQAWSTITSTPTTLSGYGITDGQPLDADLTAIAALAGTSGLLQKTGANTWALDTNTYATQAYADALVVGLLDDRGSFDASGNVFPSSGGSGSAGAILKGDLWFISVAGVLGGVVVEVGDSVRALTDTPGQTAGNWSVLQANLSYVPENVANKATSFGALNNTLYPTTQAVANAFQPLSSNLSTFAAIAPSANVQTLLGAADYSAFRSSLGLGTLATQNGLTVGSTAIASGTDTRVLFDDGGVLGESANLVFNKTTGSLTLGGTQGSINLKNTGYVGWVGRSVFKSSADGQAELFANNGTTPGNLTLASVNKLTITAPATSATLTIADGKTLTASNSLTFTGTDGSSLAIGGGGTLGSAAFTSAGAYEVPLTFGNGVSRSVNAVSLDQAFAPTWSGLHTFNRKITLTTSTANESLFTSTGGSNTGSNAASAFDMSWTLNTSGSPDVFALRVTDTARGTTTRLFNIYAGVAGATHVFSVDRLGSIRSGGGIVTNWSSGGTVVLSDIGFTDNAMAVASGWPIGWASSATNASASRDAAFSRISPGLIGAGTGAQGSFAGSLKLSDLIAVGAGATHGELLTVSSSSEQLTLSTGGTNTLTTANLIPANAKIIAITYRITTAIATATAFTVKVAGGNVFNSIGTGTSSQTTLTINTTGILVPAAFADQYNTAAAKISIDTTGTPSAGVIRLTVHYITLGAATS